MRKPYTTCGVGCIRMTHKGAAYTILLTAERMSKMKKGLALLLTALLAVIPAGCAGGEDAAQSSASLSSSAASSTAEDGSAPAASSGAMVIYFSCTGNTEAVAQEIARQTGAPLAKIVPEQPYTAEDLDYGSDDCRANREMNDDNARPAISGTIDGLEDCDTLYIGFPIWWGSMPRILNTFFDTYDLSGKTILPFCTSGGSGISEAISAIRAAEPGADVRDGLRIAGNSADGCADEVAAWLDGQ